MLMNYVKLAVLEGVDPSPNNICAAGAIVGLNAPERAHAARARQPPLPASQRDHPWLRQGARRLAARSLAHHGALDLARSG